MFVTVLIFLLEASSFTSQCESAVHLCVVYLVCGGGGTGPSLECVHTPGNIAVLDTVSCAALKDEDGGGASKPQST